MWIKPQNQFTFVLYFGYPKRVCPGCFGVQNFLSMTFKTTYFTPRLNSMYNEPTMTKKMTMTFQLLQMVYKTFVQNKTQVLLCATRNKESRLSYLRSSILDKKNIVNEEISGVLLYKHIM